MKAVSRDCGASLFCENFPDVAEFFFFAGWEQIRKTEKVFVSNADTWTIETGDPAVLCIGRLFDGEKLIGLFNFSEYDKTAWINEDDGGYVELISGNDMKPVEVHMPPYGFYYLKKKEIK